MTSTIKTAARHGSRQAISKVVVPFSRFWLAPMPAFNFALFRTGLGLATFIWFATLIPDFTTFFGEGSLAIEQLPGKGTFSVYHLFKSDIYLWIGLTLAILASGTLIAGRLTRIGGPVLGVLVPSFMAENRMLWNAGDDLLQTFCLLFGIFCLLTPSADLDTSLRGARGSDSTLTTGRMWFFQMVRIQISIVYLIAFLAKIPGSMWRDGTAAMVALRLETMQRLPVPALFENNLLVGNLTSWGTLVLEGALPFLLWNQRTRSAAIAAAVVFHLMIDWSMTIGLFSWVMILGLTTFLTPVSGRLIRSTTGGFVRDVRSPQHV